MGPSLDRLSSDTAQGSCTLSSATGQDGKIRYARPMSTQPVERARRPSAEVRELMLTAARELFLAKGYEAATTKEIALRAGVSERLLFTNFGAKGALFRDAMIPPFAALTDSYVQ